MKRKLILFAILLFALCVVTAVACADISNVQFRQERNGKITITWDDPDNNGPYEVFWNQDTWTNWNACEEDYYQGKSATVVCLIPGASYNVTVRNSSSSVTVPYTVPKSTFTDWKSSKKIDVDIGDFDVMANSRYKTFRFRFYYPRLGSARRYTLVLALRTPLGYASYVFYYDSFKIEKNYGYYFDDLDLAKWIDNLENIYGGKVPSGLYFAEAYLDGQFYASWGFNIYGN